MDNLTLKPQYNDPLSSVAVSMQSIARALNRTDQAISWDAVSENVSAGFGPKLYSIGDEFEETWTDTLNNISYKMPLHVNHFDKYTDETGKILNGMVLQTKYIFGHEYPVISFSGMSYSSNRAFLRCPDGLDAGTYNITFDAEVYRELPNAAGKTYSFMLTKPVPKGGSLFGLCAEDDYSIGGCLAQSSWWFVSLDTDGMTEIERQDESAFTLGTNGTSLGVMKLNEHNGNLNSLSEIVYGSNRWRISKLRQYLNSDAPAGQGWWTKQDDWDVGLYSLDDRNYELELPGFLCGLSDDLKSKLKTIKNETIAWDPDTKSYATDVTYDKIFIPSATEMCIVSTDAKWQDYPEFFEDKGVYHEYWQEIYGQDYLTIAQLGTENYGLAFGYTVWTSMGYGSIVLRSTYQLSKYFPARIAEMNTCGVEGSYPRAWFGFLPTMVIG